MNFVGRYGAGTLQYCSCLFKLCVHQAIAKYFTHELCLSGFAPMLMQLIWSYKRNITLDVRFDSAVADVCASALRQVGWFLTYQLVVVVIAIHCALCLSQE